MTKNWRLGVHAATTGRANMKGPVVTNDALREINGYLLDMDGTTYLGNRVLPGAREFIRLLEEEGKKYLWLTNNSSKSAGEWTAKLRGMGFDASDDDVFTSGNATVSYLLKQRPQPRLYVLGTEYFEDELKRAGCVLTDDGPDYVVLGFDMTLTYEKLRTACLLIRAGVPFIASHPDKVCPTEEGYIPDCGAMIALITEATGVKPKVLGKPFKEMIDGALDRLALSPGEVAMVGDRLYTDIQMGKNADIPTVLVLTGETSREDLLDSSVQPDYVFDSLGHLAEVLGEEQA